MPPVTIYTKPWCPYCIAAKELLTEKGVPFPRLTSWAMRTSVTR